MPCVFVYSDSSVSWKTSEKKAQKHYIYIFIGLLLIVESQTAKFSVLLLCSWILASESQDHLAGVAPMPTFEHSSSGEHQLLHLRASNCSLKIAFVEPRLPPSIQCITLILLPLVLKHWDYWHLSPCCFLFKFVLLFVCVAVEQTHSFLHVMQALYQLRHSTSTKHVRNWDFTWL